MILCILNNLFPDVQGKDSFDLDGTPGVFTDSHSLTGYLDSIEKPHHVLRLNDINEVLSLATNNPMYTYDVLLGLPTNPLMDDADLITQVINAVKNTDNIHLIFANGWDYYSGKLYTSQGGSKELAVNRKNVFTTIFKNTDIDLKRIHFWICNMHEVSIFETAFHPADVQYFSVYPKRLCIQNFKAGIDLYNPPGRNVQREYHFICLNNYEKPHRSSLVETFKNTDLKEKILYSYLNPNNKELQTFIDGSHDANNITEWQDILPTDIIDKSYLYISTETHFENEKTLLQKEDTSFINPVQGWWSEKTFKAFYWEKPFIVVAPTSTLQFLKQLGFETFPEFFDETYDSIVDNHERLELLKGEIFKTCSKSLEEIHDLYYSDTVQQKLKHNKKLFYQLEKLTPFNRYYNCYNTITTDNQEILKILEFYNQINEFSK